MANPVAQEAGQVWELDQLVAEHAIVNEYWSNNAVAEALCGLLVWEMMVALWAGESVSYGDGGGGGKAAKGIPWYSRVDPIFCSELKGLE
jgi:hypothetical protein